MIITIAMIETKIEFLTDLHCHLLPGMDDGAKDIETSVQLLKIEYDSGVRQITFTSHFDCEKMNLDLFLKNRERAFNSVKKEINDKYPEWKDLKLSLGAEVKYSPNLLNLPLDSLCIENTNYLLLELSFHMLPTYFESITRQIIMMGIIPIVAHVERYNYIIDNPTILCDWIDEGMLIQMNAESFLRKNRDSKLCFNLVKWNLVHVIASDAHSIHRRPVNLQEGLESIRIRLGDKVVNNLISNANCVFIGDYPKQYEMYCPRKILGRWR